jgi:hypothetical protein
MELPRNSFSVRRAGAEPRLETSTAVYDEGEPIEARWSFAPGNR